jgi:hypothetical protein
MVTADRNVLDHVVDIAAKELAQEDGDLVVRGKIFSGVLDVFDSRSGYHTRPR